MILTRLFYSAIIGICCTVPLFPSAAPSSQSTLLSKQIPNESREEQRDRYLGVIKRLDATNTELREQNTELREKHEKTCKEMAQHHQEELNRVQQACNTELRELRPELERTHRLEILLHTMQRQQIHDQKMLLHKMDTINGVGYLGNALTFCVGMLDRITTSNTSFKEQILWRAMPLSFWSSCAFYAEVYRNKAAIVEHMSISATTNRQFSVTYFLTYPAIAAAAYLLGFGCGTIIDHLTTRFSKT